MQEAPGKTICAVCHQLVYLDACKCVDEKRRLAGE
jgi:hypothetical protein